MSEINTRELWQPYATWVRNRFCNKNYTIFAQVVVSFAFGLLLSPWTSGLYFLIIYALIYEVFFYLFTKGESPYYSFEERVLVIFFYIFGYIFGRILCTRDVKDIEF